MLGIYCRTSNGKQERYTIETQREGGIQCATKLGLGYKIYDVDQGVSGTLDDSVRDGLADLFKDIKDGEITHVYCVDQSRIERSTRTWEFFVALCINHNVRYFPGGVFFDLESAPNMLFARLMSLVNSYYAEITSKKVRDANAKKAKAGKTHGLKPYGYKKGKNNKYVIDKFEAKHVEEMFKLSLEGHGAYTIANIFNERKIPTKFKKNFKGEMTRRDKYTKKKITYKKSDVLWRGNVISDMLRNKMYKGIREWQKYKDEVYYEDGKMKKRKVPDELIVYKDIPVIIKPELFDAVNANLSENKKNTGRKAQYNYLLNGLIYCGHCGKEVLGKKRPKGNDNAYKCRGKRPPHKDCQDSRGISLPKLETFVIKHLFESKELKKMLVEAPKNMSLPIKLKKKLKKKVDEYELSNKKINRIKQITLNLKTEPEYLQSYIDELTKETSRNKELKLEAGRLEKELAEAQNNIRNDRSRTLIESYTDEVGFEETKRLVHSLIEEIIITHVPINKSGVYEILIKYKYYDEEALFYTNWKALKWNWVSRYRKKAINEEDVERDRKETIALMEFEGVNIKEALEKYSMKKGIPVSKLQYMNPYSEEFIGNEVVTSMHETITLDINLLLDFD